MIFKGLILFTVGAVVTASLISKAATTTPKPNQPNTTLSPAGLAVTDAMLNFCEKIDPAQSATYSKAFSLISQGHVPAEMAALRANPNYGKVQASVNAQLLKVPTASAISACRKFGR